MAALNHEKQRGAGKGRHQHAIDDHQKFLSFLVNSDCYGIDILRIKEIIEYGSVQTVPRMPSFICGAINLRGRVVPVIDLSISLGENKSDITKRSCIVIVELSVEGTKVVVGVIVDSVNEVVDLARSEIEPPPSFGGKIPTEFISGMGKKQGVFVILLNIDRLLSLNELNELMDLRQRQAAIIKEQMASNTRVNADVTAEFSRKDSSHSRPGDH